VRLELALLSNLFTMALREWRIGLTHNPVSLVRKPTPRRRERRLNAGEEARLLAASDKQANPMFGWIVRLALYSGMRLGEIATLRRPLSSYEPACASWPVGSSYHLRPQKVSEAAE
jgi:integrase